MVVVGVQPWAALFGTHRFHTCYLSRYLSNEFGGLKETILLLFVDGWLSGVCASAKLGSLHDLLFRPKRGGFPGKMQMFENLAAEA
jgi:hypothetical protein